MNQRNYIGVVVLALIQAACGGGGGGGGGGGDSGGGASLSGTVPGTQIEAFGDNGSYYVVESSDNGTAEHPFTLDLAAGVGFHLAMVTNAGTPDEVVTPVGFRDSSGTVHTRLTLGEGEQVDLGHVPLYMSREEAANDDLDDDGVLDSPLVLDDVGAGNPLSQSDADHDGIDDWDDPDHGGYDYDSNTTDPQDHDDDGIPNSYDDDYVAGTNDGDSDGLPDYVDANPDNESDHGNTTLPGDCDHDGYNDEDDNHDGFYDDDEDLDGYHDDDLDHDGDHDNDPEDENDDSGMCRGGMSSL